MLTASGLDTGVMISSPADMRAPTRLVVGRDEPGSSAPGQSPGRKARGEHRQQDQARDQADFEDQTVKHRRAIPSSSRQTPGLPPPAPEISAPRRGTAGPRRAPSSPPEPGAPAPPWSGCSS